MGRISLTALQVRRRALASLEAQKTKIRPAWLEVLGEIPPAQVLTRPQPPRQHLTETRLKTLPDGRVQRVVKVIEPHQTKSARSHTRNLFKPQPIRYEEDALRRRFFQDHPWELARPRVVLETTGDQHRDADWSTGLQQPGIPLSGESVVQRQLWILHHVPDVTVAQAYDAARKEFYALRRREQIRARVAAEEARHMGARFGKSFIDVGVGIENHVYDEWEAWSRQLVSQQQQSMAAFAGTMGSDVPGPDEAAAFDDDDDGGVGVGVGDGQQRQGIGAGVFNGERDRAALYKRGADKA